MTETDDPSGATPPERSSHAQLEYSDDHWKLSAQAGEPEPRKSPGIVPALENAIAIVEMLNQNAPTEMTLAEITQELSISKSHCHSILKTLTYFGWLRFNDRTKSYSLDSGILSSAHSLLNSPVVSVIRSHLAELSEKRNIPLVLTQPVADDSFVVIDKFTSRNALEICFPVGHRFPRDACAQMRACLGWQPQKRLDAWMARWQPIRYSSKTPLQAKAVIHEVEMTRSRGYARSVGEFTEGIMALALPIFSRDGEVIYIFNCSLMIQDCMAREHEIASAMIDTAAQIHRAILARVPPGFPTSLSEA